MIDILKQVDRVMSKKSSTSRWSRFPDSTAALSLISINRERNRNCGYHRPRYPNKKSERWAYTRRVGWGESGLIIVFCFVLFKGRWAFNSSIKSSITSHQTIKLDFFMIIYPVISWVQLPSTLASISVLK